LRISPKGILPVLARLSLRLVEGRDISKEAKNFPGFNEFLKSLEVIKDENPISTLGISRDDMERLYNMVNDSNKTVIGFGMGLTQHVGGVENVMAITGLSLLIDGILFPNRGKINVQGAGDVGVEPAWKPLEGFVEYDWSDDFLTHDGKVSTRALYEDEVELVWVMGTNPSHSMPHLNLLDKSFKDKFIIYQHHHPGRTMEFADVVLPSRVVSEVDGSVTNGERRVRGFFGGVEETGAGRKNTIGIAAPQKALSNFEILNKFGQYMQVVGFPFANEQDAFEEIVQVIRGYQKLEISEVAGKDGDFANKQPPKKEFFPVKYDNDHFQGDGQYPFVFTTARSKYHFCTGEATRNSATLIKLDAVPFVRMSHSDAKLLGLLDGGRVRIYSKVGEIEANIKVDASIEKRVLIAPYHFEKLLVNKLTPLELDPVSKTPGYKYISVNVELI
jgi:formate dehydrogenase major subunit